MPSRLRNTAGKGNAAEVAVCRLLERDGWVVGSRRHIAGPGDLIAVQAGRAPRLIEVKATQRPYTGFPPADRMEMLSFARAHDFTPELAWVRDGKVVFVRWAAWPKI